MFEIYSKAGCSFCDKLKQFMRLQGIEFKEYKLDEDYKVETFVNKFGPEATFPRVILEGEVIGGMKETLIYLKTNDYV